MKRAGVVMFFVALGALILPCLIVAVPVFAFGFQIILALCLVFIGLKRSFLEAFFAGIAGLLIMVVFWGNPYSVLVPIRGIFMGIVIGLGIKREKSFSDIFIRGAAAYFLPCVFMLGIYNSVMGAGAINSAVNTYFSGMSESFSQTITELIGAGKLGGLVELGGEVSTAGVIAEVNLVLEYLKMAFLTFIPALLVIISMFAAYITIILSGVVLRGEGTGRFIPGFCAMRLKGSGSVVMLLAIVGAVLAGEGTWMAVFANVAVVIFVIAMVCGLSVIDFYLRKKVRSGILRGVIYCGVFVWMLFLIEYVVLALVMLGVTDSFYKLRVVKVG